MDARDVSNRGRQGFFVGAGFLGGAVGAGGMGCAGALLGLAAGEGEPEGRVLPTPAMHQLKRP